MKIKVVSGTKYIIMGELETASVQRFDAGSAFPITANTWHVEWWETDTEEVIEIMMPTKTEFASATTPRM